MGERTHIASKDPAIAGPAWILALECKEFRGFGEWRGGKVVKLLEKIYLPVR